jgi:hypothetical protein
VFSPYPWRSVRSATQASASSTPRNSPERKRQRGNHDLIESLGSARLDWTIGFAIVVGVDEWDIYQTDEVAIWLRELQQSDPKTADLVDDAIYTLSRSGPRWADRSSTPSPTRRSQT